jgi:hypothetical protein
VGFPGVAATIRRCAAAPALRASCFVEQSAIPSPRARGEGWGEGPGGLAALLRPIAKPLNRVVKFQRLAGVRGGIRQIVSTQESPRPWG